MPRIPRPRVPSYRLHKPSGQAVVRIDGRDFYLGPWRTPRSRCEYDRIVAEWLALRRRPASSANADRGDAGTTVAGLLSAYLAFAKGYYRRHGVPTT